MVVSGFTQLTTVTVACRRLPKAGQRVSSTHAQEERPHSPESREQEVPQSKLVSDGVRIGLLQRRWAVECDGQVGDETVHGNLRVCPSPCHPGLRGSGPFKCG